MPQLDPSSFAPQLVWLAITFVVMYLLMAKLALPRIGSVIEERQRQIENDLERAAELKAQADQAKASFEKLLADAREQARKQIAAAQDELRREAEAKGNEVSRRLATQIADGETRIAAARAEALAQVRHIAADATVRIVDRLTGITVSEDEVLARLPDQREAAQ